MDTRILEKIGLTKNEISVYLALLELGSSTTGPIAKKSMLHSSRVYESLNKLIEKGLISFVIKSNRKYFSSADPDFILDILEQEKKEINEILPQLRLLKKEKTSEEKSTVYEGYKGVKTVYDNIVRALGKGDEILVFGARSQDESFMANTFFKEYTKRRVAKGIKMKIIFNTDAKETGKFYSNLENTEVRYMPKDMKTPAAVDIYGNNVGTLILKPQPMVFLITSKEVADSYKEFFKMLWNIARS
jgi:sugar-specific transcriptional regulator TrmB